jgi:hypothetical protein
MGGNVPLFHEITWGGMKMHDGSHNHVNEKKEARWPKAEADEKEKASQRFCEGREKSPEQGP